MAEKKKKKKKKADSAVANLPPADQKVADEEQAQRDYENAPSVSGVKAFCAFDEAVDITKVVPNPRNPNTHPTKQIELLAKIIMNQGWRAPITVSRRSGFIVRGHGRYEAAKLMQVDEVPVDFQNYASDAEEWADLVADNRIAELSRMDAGILKDLLIEMDTGAFDMDLTGFDSKALEAMMTIEGNPDDVEFPEHGEDAADGVTMATCPKCGEKFPV